MKTFPVKIFATLFFAIFANVLGVGIVVPLLPVYARDLGATGIYIALIFSGFSLTRSVFLPWFGRLSDRRGRKPFLLAGLFSYFLIGLAFVFAHQVYALIGIRMVQGVASAMIMPVAQAYVGDITPEGKEGITMGMFNMSVFTGLSFGPLFGGVIRDHFGLDAAFGSMGALAFAAFSLTFFLLPATGSERLGSLGRPPVRWGLLLGDRMIVGLFFFRFVYTTCIGVVWAFLPVYADAGFGLSSSAIGLLVMLGICVSGLLHLPMGFIADRWNKPLMVLIGGVVVAGAMGMMGRAGGFSDLFVANMVFGIGGGLSMPALMALAVLQGNRSEAMGSVMALITVAHSLGMLFGSLIAGAIMDWMQLEVAFFIGAAIMVAGTIQFIPMTRLRAAPEGA